MKGYVHSLESFGSVDGPGIRFVVFLTGCNMRCQFCHNPDTWDMEKGEQYEVDELLAKVMRYKAYWGKDGGITVSGGEPLMQIDFLIEFFKKAKEQGINTCLDTSAQPFTKEQPFFDKFNELMKYTDLVLLDIKQIDDELHKALTGHSNANILECAKYLSEINKPVWIRHVLVPGGEAASDNDELLHRLADFIKTLNNVKKIEVLPYHVFGVHKWQILGIPYKLEGVNPPTPERVENARKILNVI
ncbi:MAG: pyruvate formate-lyase-activating protein [Butyrivibrio sp.]